MNLRITEHPTRENEVDCAVVLAVEDLAVPGLEHMSTDTFCNRRPSLRASPKAARG